MSRRWFWIPVFVVAGVIGLVLAVVATVSIAGGIVDWSQERRGNVTTSEPELFTPEEASVVATAQKDGTLAVTERLVFDTPEGSSDSLAWYVGAARVGWESSELHTQFIVVPTASDVRGVVLTDDGPGEQLTVEKDDSDVDDLYDSILYRFTPEGDWTDGRHAVEISYVLDNVHVEMDGHDLMVLPLQFARGPNVAAVSYRHVNVGEGNAIQCMSNNVTFELDDSCEALRGDVGLEGSAVAWAHDDTGPVEAIAFTTPDEVTDVPESMIRQEIS